MGATLTTPSALAAFFSTSLISLAPNVILLFLPDVATNQDFGKGAAWLTMGQAVAAGGLLGDVFLHTLGSADDPTTSGLWILAGFTVFFTVDLLIRALQDGEEDHHSSMKENNAESDQSATSGSMVLLNVAADLLHNFTDGLAIGASYTTTTDRSFMEALSSRGGMATLSIFFHEVPHEIGDYCTLVKAGYSKQQAVGMQFLTSIGAMLGTLTAVLASTHAWAEERLCWLTAGGFIYLASSALLPEVLAEDGRGSRQRRILFRFTQLASFCIGVFSLYAVALLEESAGPEASAHSHHHHSSHAHHRQQQEQQTHDHHSHSHHHEL